MAGDRAVHAHQPVVARTVLPAAAGLDDVQDARQDRAVVLATSAGLVLCATYDSTRLPDGGGYGRAVLAVGRAMAGDRAVHALQYLERVYTLRLPTASDASIASLKICYQYL
jgi:hypothetical protein